MIFISRGKAIENPINGRLYQLLPLSSIEKSDEQIERVASICNEPLVFNTLFSDVFREGKYPRSSALDWIEWGKAGWEEQSHFVFATVEENGLVVAACDIKSANTESAEIGYWASTYHRGVMTNSVAAMLTIAEESGFLEFFAEVHKDNLNSQRVLERNNFLLSSNTSSKQDHILFWR